MVETLKASAEVMAERDPSHAVTMELSPKWVRVFFNGQAVADSKGAYLLHESNHIPVYYFPKGDVRLDLMTPTDKHTHCPYKGHASYYTVRVGGREAENAVWHYPQPYEDAPPELGETVAFYWDRVDAWFEEGEEVYVHARDPYKRIDAIPSTRHVQVSIGGEVVADTHRPVLLFETGMPTRYYIPKLDVRMDLLRSSDRTTRCPYKGWAHYYSVEAGGEVHPDMAWYYPQATDEASKIAGLLAFFNERVDITVDGESHPRPVTPWSKPF